MWCNVERLTLRPSAAHLVTPLETFAPKETPLPCCSVPPMISRVAHRTLPYALRQPVHQPMRLCQRQRCDWEVADVAGLRAKNHLANSRETAPALCLGFYRPYPVCSRLGAAPLVELRFCVPQEQGRASRRSSAKMAAHSLRRCSAIIDDSRVLTAPSSRCLPRLISPSAVPSSSPLADSRSTQ